MTRRLIKGLLGGGWGRCAHLGERVAWNSGYPGRVTLRIPQPAAAGTEAHWDEIDQTGTDRRAGQLSAALVGLAGIAGADQLSRKHRLTPQSERPHPGASGAADDPAGAAGGRLRQRRRRRPRRPGRPRRPRLRIGGRRPARNLKPAPKAAEQLKSEIERRPPGAFKQGSDDRRQRSRRRRPPRRRRPQRSDRRRQRRQRPGRRPQGADRDRGRRPAALRRAATAARSSAPAAPRPNGNPTTTIAPFGPAPIGVPNFVIDSFEIPPFLLPIYQACGTEYGIPWEVLAAINKIETGFGTNLNVSSAGAVGWMQFLPSSWEAFGLDANGDGRKDPYNPVDAICAAAHYLKIAGGAKHLYDAILAYNHADWYAQEVLLYARAYGRLPSDLVGSLTGPDRGRPLPGRRRRPLRRRHRRPGDAQKRRRQRTHLRQRRRSDLLLADPARDQHLRRHRLAGRRRQRRHHPQARRLAEARQVRRPRRHLRQPLHLRAAGPDRPRPPLGGDARRQGEAPAGRKPEPAAAAAGAAGRTKPAPKAPRPRPAPAPSRASTPTPPPRLSPPPTTEP